MSLRRYVASGRGGSGAILPVFLASLIVGVLVGALEGLVSQWLSLFLVFPALIGVGAGAAAAAMVHRFKLRAPGLALLIGFAGGAVGYTADHVVTYERFRSELIDVFKREQPGASDAEASAELDRQLAAKVGSPGFVGFLELAAREGVRVKRTGEKDEHGMSFTGTAAWILWGAELLIAAAVAAAMAWAKAREPFCEDCDAWYGTAMPVASGGAGSKEMYRQMTSALEVGDVDGAARAFFAPTRKPRAMFALSAATCGRCGGDAWCRLDRVMTQKRAQRSKLATWLMTRSDLSQLTDSLGRAKSGAQGQ
ncbi:MAG: hypothetical protein E6J91_07855 [Deltaproteobacteria bacterium]|nr:MAG: hypothetical protein E6J91_07855 [Deltaproteobacteria bacterium]